MKPGEPSATAWRLREPATEVGPAPEGLGWERSAEGGGEVGGQAARVREVTGGHWEREGERASAVAGARPEPPPGDLCWLAGWLCRQGWRESERCCHANTSSAAGAPVQPREATVRNWDGLWHRALSVG